MIYYISSSWSPRKENPFSSNGCYGENWSAFIYDDGVKYYSNILEGAKVYTLRVSPQMDEFHERLSDFVRYEVFYNRNVIISCAENEINNLKLFINKLDFNTENTLRDTDTKWMVHSTTEEAWQSIQEIGVLLAPSELRKLNKNITEIGLRPLLEPKDYSDYVMLDILNGCGEIVVNSRQLGYICVNHNISYNPGIRLYFDAHKIIKDGLGTRDGLHILKVKGKIPLDKYLLQVVSKNSLNYRDTWTPNTYTEYANKFFLEKMKDNNI